MKRLLTVLTGVALASSAYGSAIIKTGDVYLGVNDLGNLNVSDPYGVTINSSYTGVTLGRIGDATSPGCLCEGWGVSGSGASGYANEASGTAGLTLSSFATDDVGAGPGTFATSVVTLDGSTLTVTQHYAAAAAAPGALFANSVTIKNTGAVAVTDVRYVRVMDWDIPPTEFREFVTIKGTATTTQLELSHNDGFESGDPLAFSDEIFPGGTTDVDFEDVGPADHGAYFKFLFGDLEPGESQEFTIFYGGANNEAAALAALGAVGVELFSLGQSTNADGGPANDAHTFIFGFKGVGGEIIVPPPRVPEGGTTLVLLGSVMGGLMMARRRFAVKA